MRTWLTMLVLWLAAVLCSPAQAQSANFNAVSQILQPAALTATTINLPDQDNGSWRGAVIAIDCSKFTSGTYTVTVQGKDPISGNYYTILTGAAISAVGTQVLRVYPGITATANVSASDILPKTWRVQLTGATTPNMTLSVSAQLEY